MLADAQIIAADVDRHSSILAAVAEHGSVLAAAKALGVPKSTMHDRYHRARDGMLQAASDLYDRKPRDFVVREPAASGDVPVEELIDRLTRDYTRKAEHAAATKLVTVDVRLDGPVGLLVFGDPHLDSSLTNWPALTRDVQLVRNTKGLFGVNLGDTVDNWGGKLAGLAGHNRVTVKDANRLAHWFINEVDWLLFLMGNHCWMRADGDLLKWLVGQSGALSADWAQRVELVFPNERRVRVNHKHGFNGHSMWHANHGQLKEMRFGARDHLYTGGHIHKGGINGPIVDANTSDWMWALQCGSYKDLSDNYGVRLGGGEQNAFPSAVVIVNPEAKAPSGLLKIFPDTEEGAEILTWMRKRQAKGKPAEIA